MSSGKEGEQSSDRLSEQGNLSGQTSPGSSSRLPTTRKFVPVNGTGSPPLSSTFESSLHTSRNLRYLSPSVLERGFLQPIYFQRKRTFVHDQRPASVMDVYLNRDNPKRSRREQFTTSMLDEELHPLFDMDKNGSNASSSFSKSVRKDIGADVSAKTMKPHVPSLKGSDGKTISANVFNATQLIDEEMVDASEDRTNDIPLFAPPIKAAPTAGFLDDMVFSFGAPVERLPGQNAAVGTSTECDRSGSEGSDSSDDDSDNEQSSSTSDAEETNEQEKETKASRPPTAADSETSGAISSNVTPTSSKDVSPQTKTETSWSCPDCFITNKNVNICAACGHNKDASTTSKTLVSNIATFGKPAAGGFRFGLAPEGVKDSSAPSSTTLAVSKETALGSNGTSKPAPNATSEPKQDSCKPSTAGDSTTAAATPNASGSDKKRVAWECPDCMVQNKSDDKCVCCGHVMYKSEGGSSNATASVFGDRAFKAAPLPSTGVSFGFGTSNSASGASGGIKFGLGTSEKQTIANSEPAATVNH
ncbi:hypothetical protein OSTOST_06652 [Ostertagia ostertagi]